MSCLPVIRFKSATTLAGMAYYQATLDDAMLTGKYVHIFVVILSNLTESVSPMVLEFVLLKSYIGHSRLSQSVRFSQPRYMLVSWIGLTVIILFNCWGYKDFPCPAFHFVVSPFPLSFQVPQLSSHGPVYQLTLLSHYLGYPLSLYLLKSSTSLLLQLPLLLHW